VKKKTVKKLVAVMKTNRKSGITKTIITQEKVMTSKRHQKQMKDIAEMNAKYKEEHKGQLTYINKTFILFSVYLGIISFYALLSVLKILTVSHTQFMILCIITSVIVLAPAIFFMTKMLNGEDYPLKKMTKKQK
jgi:hypothetical protein